jgi:hypothetical protein
MRGLRVFLIIVLFILIYPGYLEAEKKEVILADFETGVPCSDEGDIIGFRRKDKVRATIVKGGTEGSKKSVIFSLLPSKSKTSVQKDLFFQGKVRRMYLATKSTKYDENGPNAISFWIKLNPGSLLITKDKRNTFGVWTYHWRFGDPYVGGQSNRGLATDSMMHGYSNFRFNKKAEGRWVRVVLTPSAFRQSRYYYHFYAARGTTDDLKFIPSVRQIQFHIFPKISKKEEIQLDQLKLIYLEPTAVFEKDFFKIKVSKDIGDFEIPVVIKNPTNKDRRYRVFISSFLGVHRNVLYGAHTLTDSFRPPRLMQNRTGGDGGIGVVELIDETGDSVIRKQKEIFIPAGGIWKGKLLHHIKPEMLGPVKTIKFKEHIFYAKRDTLTTSVIVWDPYEKLTNEMDYIEVLPSNADDGRHRPPPGFPKQKRPPKGWRSEDIPLNQVGGYFVSIIQLTD